MNLCVEERPIAEHLSTWHALLSQTRSEPVDTRVLAWRYLDNPHGRARAWALVDRDVGEVVGFSAVVPRRMRVSGRDLVAWNGVDFSVLARYRALGPALMLRRAAREAIDRGEADLLYSFPNPRMRLVHERAGHARLGTVKRFALPASLQPHLDRQRAGLPRVMRSRIARALLATPANLAWRLAVAVRLPGHADDVAQVDVAMLHRDFDPTELSSRSRITGVRDRAYLRWRYARQPGSRAGLLAASRAGQPTGYLAFHEDHDLLRISDLVALDDSAATALIHHAWRIAARHRCASVSFTALEHWRWERLAARMGFRQREDEHSVYVYVPQRHAGLVDTHDPSRWHLTLGDRAV